MSNSDSFIDEVTDELRRDQFSRWVRRYGWIVAVVVLLVVGVAAALEWREARATAEAQALGDALIAALELPDPEARAGSLARVPVEGEAGVVVALLRSAELARAGETAEAAALLEAVAADGETPVLYRDLAGIKALMLRGGEMAEADLRAALEAYAAPGQPFRLIALEQLAYADLRAGDSAAAVERLQSIAEDAGATQGLRQRAEALMLALGATPG